MNKDLLSLSMCGMTALPLFTYDALNPSTDRMMSGGRTNLKKNAKIIKKNSS